MAALDGGKTARAAVVTSREKLIQKMRQYSIYVDVKANGDRELIVGAGLADGARTVFRKFGEKRFRCRT